MNGSARGTALVVLLAGVPTLLAGVAVPQFAAAVLIGVSPAAGPGWPPGTWPACCWSPGSRWNC